MAFDPAVKYRHLLGGLNHMLRTPGVPAGARAQLEALKASVEVGAAFLDGHSQRLLGAMLHSLADTLSAEAATSTDNSIHPNSNTPAKEKS